jgi:hypothetical protein
MTSTTRKSRLALCFLIFSWPLSMGALGFRADFDSRILSAHNRERASLGLPVLRWDADLAAGAKQWADNLARSGVLAHSPDEPGQELLGENIWGGEPGMFSPEAMVRLWISEKRQFQVGTFPKNSRTGNVADVSHYTQLIWRSTKEVGCALSEGTVEEVLVCRYRNPGNVIGQEVY